MSGIFRDVRESLLGRPGRTLLVLFSVATGTLALTVLLATIMGLARKSQAITDEFGADVLAVMAPRGDGEANGGLRRAHGDVLRKNFPDYRVAGVRQYQVTSPAWKGPLPVLSVDEELLQVRPWTVESGRALDPVDIREQQLFCLISSGMERDYGLHLHDELYVHPYRFQIVGIVRANDSTLEEVGRALTPGAHFVAVPHSVTPAWDHAFTSPAAEVDRFYVKLPRRMDAAEASEKIEQILTPQLAGIGALQFISPEHLVEGIKRLQNTIELTSGSIALLCLLLGGTTLMSLMIANVRERVNEIGLRLALGGSASDIYRLFMLEALVTTGLAALIGSALGFILLRAIESRIGFPVHLAPAVFIIPIAVALLLGLVFSWWPSRQAARISPAEALRHE